MASSEKTDKLQLVGNLLFVPVNILLILLIGGFLVVISQFLTGNEGPLASMLFDVNIESSMMSFILVTTSFPFLFIGMWKAKQSQITSLINLTFFSLLAPAGIFVLPSLSADYAIGLYFNLYAVLGWIICVLAGHKLQ